MRRPAQGAPAAMRSPGGPPRPAPVQASVESLDIETLACLVRREGRRSASTRSPVWLPGGVDEAALRHLLATSWGIDADHVSPLPGGMNSQTWEVAARGSRWVAKTVAERASAGFKAGLRAAAMVQAEGIPAGAPVPTRSGRLTVELAGRSTALLTYVEGRPLTGVGNDVGLIGATLARVHRVLRGIRIPGAPAFEWIDPDATYLDAEPWVRPAVTRALEDWQEVRRDLETWGSLHGDPAPEAFLAAAQRRGCGLIDWAAGCYGPFLYDLASAVMYVGPEGQAELVSAYRAEGDMRAGEIQRGLLPMLRLRWAVQAAYFALRQCENDLTGIADEAANRKGLADARRHLCGSSRHRDS